MNKLSNSHALNPFTGGDPGRLSALLVSLMPTGPELSAEEIVRQKESSERFHEMRYGPLPHGTYRLLEQGSFVGWYFELEIDGENVVIETSSLSRFAMFCHPELVQDTARKIIESRHGHAASQSAVFRKMFGGQM